jgi:hypothetical protein
MQTLPVLLIFCFLCFPLFSQEDGGPNSDSVFIINSFEFNIDGFTRPYALINKGDLIKGEIITGLSNLEKYIQEKTQALYNERVLESVEINYTVAQVQEDGMYPVDLVINIKDTWNIVAIPRPRYSSNTGFDITLKARDYNFLGTMSPLRLDLGYIYDEKGRNSLILELDSNIPFRAFGLNWNIKFFNAFNYRPDTGQPFYYRNITGLSVELPVKFTAITIGFDESILINDENADIYKPLYGNFQDGLYMSSNPYIAWKIPTGIEAGEWGELVYTPGISATLNHEFPAWPLDDIRKGPFLTFSHTLGFRHIDWIGNFQRGLDVFIYNSFNSDFFNYDRGANPLKADLKLSGTGHFIVNNFFAISSRVMYRQWFYMEQASMQTGSGDALRGILDKDINADYMLSLNLDFPARVLKFSPSVWFNNPILRIFNFDLHLSPIIDTALYHDPVKNIDFNFKNILVTGGMEAVIFPEFFRSLYLRISFGWNLTDFSGGRNSEIYIGTDFHY